MKSNQLNRGDHKRLMYIENKNGQIAGADARIGWVTFSKSGKTIYYRGLTFLATSGGGIYGNFMEEESRDEYWISGVKHKGSNVHHAERAVVQVDDDAKQAYDEYRTAGRT